MAKWTVPNCKKCYCFDIQTVWIGETVGRTLDIIFVLEIETGALNSVLPSSYLLSWTSDFSPLTAAWIILQWSQHLSSLKIISVSFPYSSKNWNIVTGFIIKIYSQPSAIHLNFSSFQLALVFKEAKHVCAVPGMAQAAQGWRAAVFLLLPWLQEGKREGDVAVFHIPASILECPSDF